MTDRKRNRNVAVGVAVTVLLVLLLGTGASWRRIVHWYRWGCPEPLRPDVERMLWWFPEDTETVIAVPGGFAIDADAFEQGPMAPVAFLRSLASLPFSVHDGVFWTPLDGMRVALGMSGSRAFRFPGTLGWVRYEGCHVLVFEEDLGKVGDELMDRLAERASSVEEIGGFQVPVLEETVEGKKWNYYFVRPVSNVLLAATDRRFLETVLSRYRRRESLRALPPELPEWKGLDTSAPLWAVRHYKREGIGSDPTSPIVGASAIEFQDPDAVGVVFRWDPDDRVPARLTYLSSNSEAAAIMHALWTKPDYQLTPEIERVDSGAVEVSFASPESSNAFLLLLLWMLGHGVFI